LDGHNVSELESPTIDLFALGSKGIQHHDLRRANERGVLNVIGFNPGLSNAGIARMSGLAPQTVSAILNDLEAAGLIKRGEVLRGRRGQPATPIFLRPDGGFAIGVEIGWRHAQILAINFYGQVLAERYLDYEEADLAVLPSQLAALIADMTADWPTARRDRLFDLGICVPGTIDSAREPLGEGVGTKSGPSQTQFAAELESLTGLSVTLFNDGNAACWAELIAQPAPRPESFIYLLASTYLAAGLLGEGRLWQGLNGHSADLGAMLVGNAPGCARSAHAVASVTALAQRIEKSGATADMTKLQDWDWGALEEHVAAWIEESADALAFVIYNTNAVVEAPLVVMDTILPAEITARLVERLKAALAKLPPRRKISIVAGHAGRNGPALGAAELALYRRYFSRNLLEKS
jgi:predicted NBD/HSP70 family sugar kinase